MFTPFEYSYKRNCDQVKWYVDENLELPTQEDEPELAAWFNSQLECYEKHKDKRKKMFIDLMAYLEDYGIAVPHGRTAAVKQICGVIALVDNSKNDNGIIPDYETIDHSKIQIICLMLIPESMNASYLQMLSTFIRIFQNADNREQLLSCKTPKDMKRFFNSL